MLLADCPRGTIAHIRAVTAAPAHRQRLADMGLYPGQHISVLHDAPFGTRIIVVHRQRIAIDRDTTCHISVDLTQKDPS
ncbi:FeoA family protein [Jonesia denitrificans]|nr:FeoA family protein [Jonesia denitrificans]ASE09485.1 ferrous iron transport protein A [Jonesia denitrificans]QXB44032.1 ferrous iron transport protein A [Jonesia denitrificans]SQH21482.1 FeoA domain [Jonesia denitrificans]